MRKGIIPKVGLVSAGCFVILITAMHCKRGDSDNPGDTVPVEPPLTAEYVGRESCRECHEREYNLFTVSGVAWSIALS